MPKRELVGVVEVLLESERLKFASALAEVPALVRELATVRRKVDPKTAQDADGAWREGEPEDLVLAVALAAWQGTRHGGGWRDDGGPPPWRRLGGDMSAGADVASPPGVSRCP